MTDEQHRAAGVPQRTSIGEPEILAGAAILLILLHTWLARAALNPDGVSYLDLAAVLARGDWPGFVQGYWSPLYPALIAIVTSLTGREPAAAVAAAHAINGAAAILAVVVLWRWSRAVPRPFLARALFAALFLVSAGLPRIEGVIPDVLLLGLTTWLGYELLVHRGRRWLLTGFLLGAAFFAKTSLWPILLLSIPLRLWAARDATQRRQVALSSAVCAAVMAAWILPMSTEAGRLTMGSAGRLNWCWYIRACDSRTPDGHGGQHRSYHSTPAVPGAVVEWAEFPGAERWTYEPWSDPTAWQADVLTMRANSPTPWDIARYWAWQAGGTFGLWLLPLIGGVLLPFAIVYARRGFVRRSLAEERDTIAVALLGLAGIFQFIAVHSEPRLIAPYAMLFAGAVLQALAQCGGDEPRGAAPLRQALTALGLLVAIGYAVPKLRAGIEANAQMTRALERVEETRRSLAAAQLDQSRIVVLGPVMPVEASIYMMGAHVVAQVLPRSFAMFARLPADRQLEIMRTQFSPMARVGWATDSTGSFRLIVLPPP